MSSLALVENGTITNVIVGELSDFPNRIDVTGTPYGSEWMDNGDGTFSSPVVMSQYTTQFYADDLLSAFTVEEIDAIDTSAHATVQKFVRRMILRKKVLIDINDVAYTNMLGLLLSEGLVTQARHDELVQGI